jgi:hypothetical protein
VKPESLKKKEPLKYLGFVSSSESMWDFQFLTVASEVLKFVFDVPTVVYEVLRLVLEFLRLWTVAALFLTVVFVGSHMFQLKFHYLQVCPATYIGPFRKHYFNYCEGSLRMAPMESRNM